MKRKRKTHLIPHLSMRLNAVTAAAEAQSGEGFHTVATVEGVWSRDGRMIETGALYVGEGPNAPVLMGLIENTEFHDKAVNIGHYTRWEKIGAEWHGWGVWANTPEAWDIRDAVRGEHVTSVSVELANAEVQYLIPKAMLDDFEAIEDEYDEDDAAEPDEPETETIEGEEYLVVDMPQDRYRIVSAEITGASVVPTGAFGDGTIEDLLPDEQRPTEEALVAAAAPVEPPAQWFSLPDPAAPGYDVIVEDDGRIHGYPAGDWNSCHLAFPDECVTPPHSTTNYSYFTTGTIRCADGSRVRVGQLTLKGGHADRTWSMARAMAHYDDTDSAIADVAIGENEHGIWIAGALRPGASPEDVRVAMASGWSGDWRDTGGGNFELIALSAVNSPGFRRHVSEYRDPVGLVASMIVDMPNQAVADAEAILASAAERIAKSIGRDTASRVKALYEKVHS